MLDAYVPFAVYFIKHTSFHYVTDTLYRSTVYLRRVTSLLGDDVSRCSTKPGRKPRRRSITSCLAIEQD